MEGPTSTWIRESEDSFEGCYAKGVAEERCNGKRKVVERAYGLFCVMRKRHHNDTHVDDDDDHMFPYEDCCFTGSDTDLSESSEFDIILPQQAMSASNSLSPCPNDYHEEVNGASSNQDEVMLAITTLWNEPIPITVVPPTCVDGDDDGSTLLPHTCSLDHIDSSGNEYDVHDNDDKIGLDSSLIPLAKTLQGPHRPWSVCGSLAAAKNTPLVGNSLCVIISLDEHLCRDVSSTVDNDPELTRPPSILYLEDADGKEDDISFSEIDSMIRKLNILPDDPDSELSMSKHPRHPSLELEHCTRTFHQRSAIMSKGVIAVLHCRYSKHFIRKDEVIIGRTCDGLNVDIDLGKDGYGRIISRRQALVKLENCGSFSLKNLGKRHIIVNGKKLDAGQIVTLTSCSSIDIRGIVIVFKSNKEAVRQCMKKKKKMNSTKRNNKDYTKFEWCKIHNTEIYLI